MNALGIWPAFHGRAMHDRWASYDHYNCAHSLCGAHLLRDCLFVAEQEKQPWGQQMFDLLLLMKKTADAQRASGAMTLPKEVRNALVIQYFEILKAGFAAHQTQLPSPLLPPPKKQGRPKQDASKNLLDALLKRAEDVLAFLDDLSIPFTNNLAERDLRMRHPSSKRFRGRSAAPAVPLPFVSFAVT